MYTEQLVIILLAVAFVYLYWRIEKLSRQYDSLLEEMKYLSEENKRAWDALRKLARRADT